MLGQPFFPQKMNSEFISFETEKERISVKQLMTTVDFNSVHLQFSQVTSIAENDMYIVSANIPSMMELVLTHSMLQSDM